MELELKKADLMKALGVVTEVAPKKATVPILRCAVLDAADGKLVMEASDLYVSCRMEVEATVAKPGRTALPAGQFADLVRALSDAEPVKLSLTSDGVVYVRSGRSKYKLSSVSLADYVALPQPTKDFGAMSARTMRSMLEASIPSIGNEGRPQLTGVMMANHEPGKLRSVASDGLRVVRVSAESGVTMPRAVVPHKGINAIMELLSLPTKRGEAEPELKVSGDALGAHLFFDVDKTRIGVKLMDDQFPDFDKLFVTTTVDVTLEVSRAEVLDATRRALVVADAPGAPVRLVATPEALLIGSSGGDGSSGGVDEVAATVVARENMGLDNEDKPYLVRLSLRFFADAVRVAASERVKVGLSGANGPIMIYGVDSQVESLVMPMSGV